LLEDAQSIKKKKNEWLIYEKNAEDKKEIEKMG